MARTQSSSCWTPASIVLLRLHGPGHHAINCPPNSSGVTPSWRKGCRLFFTVVALVSVYSFVLMCLGMVSVYRHQQRRHRPTVWLRRDDLRPPPDSHLIDITNFEYVLEPRQLCGQGRQHIITVYVHSAPDHFEERTTIRSTWGSQWNVSTWGVRVVFLLGLCDTTLQNRVVEEHRIHDDLVQGNFVDSYRNLTYKHLMGYKWVTRRCPRTALIVKADDDVFVDVTQLHKLLVTLYGDRPRDILACSVWPSGSSPQRKDGDKWAVLYSEYPRDTYPTYCGGLAYVVSPDVARDLLAASQHVPFFWIDDLYATGLLAEAFPELRHHALNLRTTYDTAALVRWLRRSGPNNQPCPYVFGDVSGSANRHNLMHRLWRKTIRFWREHPPSVNEV